MYSSVTFVIVDQKQHDYILTIAVNIIIIVNCIKTDFPDLSNYICIFYTSVPFRYEKVTDKRTVLLASRDPKQMT